MDLYKRIEDELKTALRAGDSVRVSVLRMLLSDVKVLELEKPKRLEEADILQIIQRQIKQHRESIAQFAKGNRQDLVEKETKELKLLETYMPKQLSEDELLNIIKAAIEEAGASTKSDAGKVMKLVMDKVRGRADGKAVNQILMGLLK